MTKMFLDIETLPAETDKHTMIKEIYNKKQETGKNITKTFEEYLESTNFGGAFGRIFCLAYAFDNEQVQVLWGDERKILEKFWELAKGVDLFIGHNILDFDLKFIYQRSIVLKVRPSRELSFARYRNEPIFDIMHEWNKWGQQGFSSLDILAKALNIPTSKKEIDGSKVHQYFKDGKHQEIINYCKEDVEVTRKIYKRIIFEEEVKES